MLNNNAGVVKQTFSGVNDIVCSGNIFYSLGIQLADTGISEVDGKKIAKAGTPVAGKLTERGTAFKVLTDGTTVTDMTGVLMHDVDVTNGTNNATCLVFGGVNLNRMDSAVQAYYTAAYITALRGLGIIPVKAN